MALFEKLGPYHLGKKLGQGGMGAVYAALDAEGMPAAVKILSPALAAEEGFRVRFEAEIESLKKLRHPNIVRLFGYGEQNGVLFYGMELIDGTNLEDELRGGRRFEWREVTGIAIKLCRALKHAHDHGVIHRDLKPANIMLTADGQIKLTDFGIARLFGNTRLTSDGGVLGTAEFMAPEQADGRAITDRCDQYSLGGVLYALLAGRPPFRAKTLVEMLQLQRFSEPEPLSRLAPQTPAELARIIHQMLEKDPAKRFANTMILARSLEAMEHGLSVSRQPSDDFVLEGSEPETLSGDYVPLGPTLSPTEVSQGHAARREKTDAGHLDQTEATQLFVPPGARREAAAAAAEASGGRFTKVDEHRSSEAFELREALATMFSPQTLALVGALALLIGGGWYLMRPPTADQLYERIEQVSQSDAPASVSAAKSQIERFLSLYPADPRAEELQDSLEQIQRPDPIQRAYTEAKRLALINPELAAAKFQALVNVYDDADASSGSKHYLALARKQLNRLEAQLAGEETDQRQIVEARLARAAELAAGDPPRARQIYQGIVELYADKRWAGPLVAQARAGLQSLDAAQASVP